MLEFRAQRLRDLDAPGVFFRQREGRKAFPRRHVAGVGAERADRRQPRCDLAKRFGYLVAHPGEVRARDVVQARVDACRERPFILSQHIRQPVPAFLEHLRQEALDVVPTVVDTLEQQLDVRSQRLICIACHEDAARGAVVDLLRPLGHDQRAPRFCGHRKLTREPEIEGVDGLDAQTAGILGQSPMAFRVPLAHGTGEFAQTGGLRMFRIHVTEKCFQHALAHFGGSLTRERDRKNLFRVVDMREQAQQALRKNRGLA